MMLQLKRDHLSAQSLQLPRRYVLQVVGTVLEGTSDVSLKMLFRCGIAGTAMWCDLILAPYVVRRRAEFKLGLVDEPGKPRAVVVWDNVKMQWRY